MSTLLFVLAIVALILVPLAPNLIRLRIRFFKWLEWTWAVNLLEKYFDRWVLTVRVILLLLAAVLFYSSLEELA
jgi:hypothetical protein